jgi:tetratricopeptide (TPR) repeat protein
MTYRKLANFQAAEHHARQAIATAIAIDSGTEKPLELSFPTEMDDPDWPLGLILVLAHVQLASSLAERDAGGAARRGNLKAAKDVLERMEKIPGLSGAYREGLSDYRAACGRAHLAEGRLDAAIADLKAAGDLDPGEADVYLLLARAHALAAERRVEEDWQAHIRAARAACRRTRDIGGDEHPDAIAAAMLEEELARIDVAATARLAVTPRPDVEPDGGKAAPDVVGTLAKGQAAAKKRASSPRRRRSDGPGGGQDIRDPRPGRREGSPDKPK